MLSVGYAPVHFGTFGFVGELVGGGLAIAGSDLIIVSPKAYFALCFPSSIIENNYQPIS